MISFVLQYYHMVSGFPNLIIRAALEAGDKILEIYKDSNLSIEFKDDKSPLTLADKESHNKIISFLEQTPYPVVSEESNNEDYSIRRRWAQ